MENQHSQNIILIVLCTLILSACNDAKDKGKLQSEIPTKTIQEAQVNKAKVVEEVKQTTRVVNDSTSISDLKRIEDQAKEAKPKVKKSVEKVKSKPKKKAKKKKKVYPKIEFETELYDFGEITEGDTINYSFKFTNTGKKTLDIKSASATCGCTQPSYPFIGVEPGDEGNISVRYISVGKSGAQEATITIKSNAAMPTRKLLLKGFVKDKEDEPQVEKDSTEVKQEEK